MNAEEFRAFCGQLKVDLPEVAVGVFPEDDPDSKTRIEEWEESLGRVEFDVAAKVVRDIRDGLRRVPEPWSRLLAEIHSAQRKSLEDSRPDRYWKPDPLPERPMEAKGPWCSNTQFKRRVYRMNNSQAESDWGNIWVRCGGKVVGATEMCDEEAKVIKAMPTPPAVKRYEAPREEPVDLEKAG